jgi:hypothetical protein
MDPPLFLFLFPMEKWTLSPSWHENVTELGFFNQPGSIRTVQYFPSLPQLLYLFIQICVEKTFSLVPAMQRLFNLQTILYTFLFQAQVNIRLCRISNHCDTFSHLMKQQESWPGSDASSNNYCMYQIELYVMQTLLIYQRLVTMGSPEFPCLLSHWNQTNSVSCCVRREEEPSGAVWRRWQATW